MGVLSRVNIRYGIQMVVLAALGLAAPLKALETDQFYAWNKPIEDSAVYLNAWVKLTIQSALDSGSVHKKNDCEAVVKTIQKDLQHSIYQPIELWIISSNLIDRIPKGAEADRHYRSNYLLSDTFLFDHARWLQPSPTLQVNEIRFGSDKLAHFFSEGWWYYKHWKKRKDKHTPEEIDLSLFEKCVKLEHGIQGMKTTGVFSPADLEANYQGFVFCQKMCHGEEPLIYQHEGRWQFSDRFDISDYISPKWDESWNPNIYSKRRWKGISSTIATYCPQLDSDWVNQQRAHYANLDAATTTDDLIREFVASGKIPDPQDYDITKVCEARGS